MKPRLAAALLNFLVAVVVGAAATIPARAAPVTFNVEWSGLSVGNLARASGFITAESTLLPQISPFLSTGSVPSPAVLGLGITISGAISGNGSFGMSDFGAILFGAPSSLDLSRELIGQALSNGSSFGVSRGPGGDGAGGAFTLFGSTPGAPSGTWYFELTTFNGAGDRMLVTSMAPVADPTSPVPLPAPIALLASGLALLGWVGRRGETGVGKG